MNIELKPIAESKVRQLGGDVCGVLVRKDEKLAAVDEHGRVQWLHGDSEHTAYLEGMNAHLRAELKAARAQGGRGADAVKWSDPAVDPIVSKLYRKFKEWNRQGFGADDVTWCEVRGYVAELLNTQPQPAVPEEYRQALQDAYDIIVCDANSPKNYGSLCRIGHVLGQITTPTTPQADGWKVKFMQIMSEIYSDLDDEHEDPIPSDLWDLWRDLRAATQPPTGQEGES